ncbi:molybdopterin oxidoreductase family protein [Sulfitobacter geojensis]|uniref:Molybdopterin oxidoreductase family protein n=1 Tax=Sulfitobacter geojensis TaxID=1342299 RepID=A0AAE3B731_9RHOB|nr:molybdopterin oxidoreductase family protein [Sulfitobacter geojensis]MBM1690526.1 molybdopterin oxidoreductase family protein [Sulfitobacter geojensis]MBM1694592.1 molybdopterin oxidoreductase family protein [Sulfitobacter geojensis]MBM1706758.1 molybdopterin oxidoreductase family protein [Sulfitobacter geojensis]MBM1710816.1 molybdopterin oxidoreductase family protein [Sulfitobacter geojensis]MBM1714882.1 molybdopterin oxidoreductase family protein [Sulfitobacter geojensis]
MNQPKLDLSPKVSDEIRKTTCYMCACRCGINVHLKEGKVAYIEGNRDHPVNKGVLCAKGSAGIMQHNAPSRLKSPLKRVGPRGSGEFEEISWDEAYQIAADWLEPIRKDNPEKLAFFTGRDQSQSFTSLWAQAFGTPNYAAHGGFCSVNMAAAGIYTMGGAFWEFGQPDWDHTKLFMLFGVAEDHDSNPIKMGIGKIKGRGARVIGVNPIRTGYNAVADDWVGITPGTDGLFILSMIHCLMKAGKMDLNYLAQYTDAPVLVNNDEKSPEYGLYLRDESGKQLVVDRVTGKLTPYDKPGVKPDLSATHRAKGVTHRPVFHQMAEMYLSDEYAPEAVAERCGIPAKRIRAIAAELARVAFDEAFELDHAWTDFRGEKHKTMTGRPVSFHAMRGISAHANGFQTCRALHTLQIILGTVEVPGGFRFKPPYPKPATAHPKPHVGMTPGAPLNGPHLGFVHGPDDLALKEDGTPARIDKAFTWENPMSSHGLMHMVISNAHAGDPYKIDTLFMYMANMSWNSSMNTGGVMEMLTDKDENGDYVIPHIIYSDAYSSEMVAYSDLILPDTTYLERHDCISLLDRPICEADAAADAIRWPVVEPDRNVKGFQSALCDLGAKLGLPGFVNEDGTQKYADYADYIINHERRPGIGPLAGWRMGEKGLQSGRGGVNEGQIDNYIENGGFFVEHIPDGANYYKPWNMKYQEWAVGMGLFDSPQPYLFSLYVEPMRKFQLAAEGHGERQPPDHLRQRIKETMSPLPIWYETDQQGNEGYTINALTQRPMAMYHSWGSQNAWLRQLHGHNPLYLPTKLMRQNDLSDGDWARVSSPHGEITVPVMEMAALNENTVWTWNAIGKRKGAWALDKDAPEATKGFLLNHLIHELLPPKADGMRWANSDPITGQAAWFDLKVRIEKTEAPKESRPEYPPIKSPVGKGPDKLAWKVGK